MPTEIKITDAERGLAALIQRVAKEGERIVLAAQDRPKAALISLADLRTLEILEDGKEALGRELPALLRVLGELQEAVETRDQTRSQDLLEEIDDFLAVLAVAGEPVRSWDEFVSELDADVSAGHQT